MDRYNWFRVSLREGDSLGLASALTEALPVVGEGCFTVRRPEVHDAGGVWAEFLHDGNVVCGSEVSRMIAAMIDDGGMWCELDSEFVRIHPSEMAIYVGLAPDVSLVGFADSPAIFERVATSPFHADVHTPEYQAVTKDFWRRVGELIDLKGSLVLLSQWAAGVGGEKWYLLENSSDLAPVAQDMVPRSVVVVFPPASVRRIENPLTSDADDVLRYVDLFGDLRWLVVDSAPRLRSEMVDNEQDLREKLGSSKSGELLLSWPESKEELLAIAASPDSDGVVRTSLSIYE